MHAFTKQHEADNLIGQTWSGKWKVGYESMCPNSWNRDNALVLMTVGLSPRRILRNDGEGQTDMFLKGHEGAQLRQYRVQTDMMWDTLFDGAVYQDRRKSNGYDSAKLGWDRVSMSKAIQRRQYRNDRFKVSSVEFYEFMKMHSSIPRLGIN